jgi:hypothetical protein
MATAPAPMPVPVPAPEPKAVNTTGTTTVTVPVTIVPPGVSGRKQKDRKPKSGSNRITDVKIVLGFTTPDGARQEAVYMVDADRYLIDGYSFTDEGKIAKARDEEGNLVGFESTGERNMVLKVKYHEE